MSSNIVINRKAYWLSELPEPWLGAGDGVDDATLDRVRSGYRITLPQVLMRPGALAEALRVSEAAVLGVVHSDLRIDRLRDDEGNVTHVDALRVAMVLREQEQELEDEVEDRKRALALVRLMTVSPEGADEIN